MANKDTPAVTSVERVSELLKQWPSPRGDDQRVAVPTQCLFGSGAIIWVVVEGGPHRFRVHDGGAAIDEFSNSGGINPKAVHALRLHFRDQGISVGKDGAILSPEVPAEELAVAVALIGNAAREGEDLLFSRWRPRIRRDFKRLLKDLLESEFPERLKPEVRVAGSSQKQHIFDFSLDRPGGGRVLLDAVLHDQNSISSTVLRNIDVRDRKGRDIEQRIIFDDAEEWSAEDLNLLKLGGSVIAFSQAPQVLHRLAA